MDLIVAVDENWGIGKEGDLLCPIASDLKRFREMTTGNVIVMGRKTLESFPNGKPLPKRAHVVLTKNKDYAVEGVSLCYGVEELSGLLQQYGDKKVFVVGGGSVYQQLLPYCEKAYITKIHNVFAADTYFPNLGALEDWTLVEQGEVQEEKGVRFSFDLYQRI